MLSLSCAPRERSRFLANACLATWSRPRSGFNVGGDWCEAHQLSRHRLLVIVGDVCGHGPAAYQKMVAVKETILAAARQEGDLPAIMRAANETAHLRDDGLPVTALVATFDCGHRRLTFANAGHPRPLMHTSTGYSFVGSYPRSIPLGITAHHDAVPQTVRVPAGAMLSFYTDGIIERERDAIKGERDLALAAAYAHRHPYLNAAQAIVHKLTGGTCEFEDDAAILTLRTA